MINHAKHHYDFQPLSINDISQLNRTVRQPNFLVTHQPMLALADTGTKTSKKSNFTASTTNAKATPHPRIRALDHTQAEKTGRKSKKFRCTKQETDPLCQSNIYAS